MKKVAKILIFMICVLLIPVFFKSARFNLIIGGERLLSRSSTKNESRKRGVYICDVKLPNSPYKVNDSIFLEIKDGWIEKRWRSGYWYWTTFKEEGFHVIMESKKKAEAVFHQSF